MAEIKLNESFTTEVAAFRAAGEALDTVNVNSVSAGDISLPTVDAYQDRLFKIWKVIFKFELLTKKDAADMDALAASLKAADITGGYLQGEQ